MAKISQHKILLAAAKLFLSWMSTQEPAYEERIEITKSEYGLDDLQTLANYTARVLDLGEHMVYVERPWTLNPNYWESDVSIGMCASCGEPVDQQSSSFCSKQTCQEMKTSLLDQAFENAKK